MARYNFSEPFFSSPSLQISSETASLSSSKFNSKIFFNIFLMPSDVDPRFLQFVPSPIWEALSSDDRDSFFDFQKKISKNKLNYVGSFDDDLEMIKKFIYRRKGNVHERGILIGVLFFEDIVCVNIQQLKVILNRCKSTINCGFQVVGYLSIKAKVKEIIETFIPLLAKYPKILRKWTLRYKRNVNSNIFMLLSDSCSLNSISCRNSSCLNSNYSNKIQLPIPVLSQNGMKKLSLSEYLPIEPDISTGTTECENNIDEFAQNYQRFNEDNVLDYMNDDKDFDCQNPSIDFGLNIYNV